MYFLNSFITTDICLKLEISGEKWRTYEGRVEHPL
jgi:hypothetical protein